MKKAILLIAITLAGFTYAVSLSLRDMATVPETLDAANHPGFYDYRGIINVQTTASQGYLPSLDVIRLAQEAKFDFIIFTELNHFLPGGTPEGYQRQLLTINGGKFSYLESRLLTLDPERLREAESLGQAQTIIADLLSRVGSHRRPISSPNASPTPKDTLALGQISREGTEWTGAYPSGLAGLEVLNLRQMLARSWRDTRLSALWSMLIYPFNSDLALIRLFADLETSFDSWDRLSRERGTFGFLGTDAGIPSSVLGLTVKAPSYQKLFGLASNHVLLRTELTGEYESDRRKILTAIQEGQTYFAFDTLGQTKGFAAWYEDQRGIQSLGARIPLNSNGRILVRLPKKPSVPFEIVILRDSMNVMTSNSTTTEYRTLQSGVYRVVVRLFIRSTLFDGGRWIPWIMTNPITVTP